VDNSSSETTNFSQTIAEQNNIGVQNNYSNTQSKATGFQEPKLNALEKKIFDKIFSDGQSGEEVLLNDICENEHFFADALKTLQEKNLIHNCTVKTITYSGVSGTIKGTPNEIKFAAKLTTDGFNYGNKLKKEKEKADSWKGKSLPFRAPKIK
jgi:hypothetical protein